MVAILGLFSVAPNAMTKRPQEEIGRESESPHKPIQPKSLLGSMEVVSSCP